MVTDRVQAAVAAAVLIVLVGSLFGNVLLFDAWAEANDRATAAAQRERTANATAKACGESVQQLRQAAADQRKAIEAELARAKRQARDANARADAERNRPQAVPGNACASAEVETREWLQRRAAQ